MKIRRRRDRLPTPVFLGFPCGSAGKESACNVGRPGFDPWAGKILWRRERPPTPVSWPGEFHGLNRPWGRKESAGLSDFHFYSFTFGSNWWCCYHKSSRWQRWLNVRQKHLEERSYSLKIRFDLISFCIIFCPYLPPPPPHRWGPRESEVGRAAQTPLHCFRGLFCSSRKRFHQPIYTKALKSATSVTPLLFPIMAF